MQENFSERLVFGLNQAGQLGDTIFYLQSDKLDFVQRSAASLIRQYVSFTTPGILIPSRTTETMQQYPAFQQTQEAFLNFIVGDYIGIVQDYFAGPKLFPAQLTFFLQHIQGDIGWGVEAYLYVIAKKLNLPFHFFPIDMAPPQDVGDPTQIKASRLRVTQQIIEGFTQAQRLEMMKA